MSPTRKVRNGDDQAQANRTADSSLRRHSVASTDKKLTKKGPKIAKIQFFGDFWPFFGDFLSVLATLCRRSERACMRFAWAWICCTVVKIPTGLYRFSDLTNVVQEFL